MSEDLDPIQLAWNPTPPPPSEDEIPFSVPMPPQRELRDRLTMTLWFHHQHHGEKATSVNAVCHGLVEKMEEPYSRRMEFTNEWSPLVDSRCWIESKEVGFILFENLEGKGLKQQPPPEELAVINARVIQIHPVDSPDNADCIVIPPGWTLPLRFSDPTYWQVRCATDLAHCRVTFFPR